MMKLNKVLAGSLVLALTGFLGSGFFGCSAIFQKMGARHTESPTTVPNADTGEDIGAWEDSASRGDRSEFTGRVAQQIAQDVAEEKKALPGHPRLLAEIREAADGGDMAAQYEVGLKYLFGDEVPEDPALAVTYFKKAAAQGHIGAAAQLGHAAYLGEGTAANPEEAEKWSLKAAEKGDAHSQYIMGLIKSSHYKTRDEALRWFQLAAEQRDPDAANKLGDIYYLGQLGFEKNHAKARRWYLDAARGGDPASQLIMALWYEEGGKGIEQDFAQAAKWFGRAAEQGELSAQVRLGILHEKGLGVSKNLTEAALQYRMAAEAGSADAQYHLSTLYYNGDGVSQDHAEAYKWITLATTDQKDRKYMTWRNKLAEELALKDLNEGQRRADLYLAKQSPESKLTTTFPSRIDRPLNVQSEKAVPEVPQKALKQPAVSPKVPDADTKGFSGKLPAAASSSAASSAASKPRKPSQEP